MASLSFSDRRASQGEALARALLDTREPLAFEQLMDAARPAEPGEVAAWVGHAVAEGLLAEGASGFALRARGRRVLGARRRQADDVRPVAQS